MSPKIPQSFHHYLSVKSNTWADCQVKLTKKKKKKKKKKKFASSFREWIAVVKTEEKALPHDGELQAVAGISTAVGCWDHLVF